MRETFRDYYEPTDEELEELWNDCIFVFDANVLLGLYRWSKKTRHDILDALTELAEDDRLWLPHQVVAEYQFNRPRQITRSLNRYPPVLKKLRSYRKEVRKALDSQRHPFADAEVVDAWVDAIDTLKAKLREREKELGSLKSEDTIREHLEEILEGRIGDPFDSERLDQIAEEGESRYERRIPPGYRDAEYKEGDRGVRSTTFGDLILWFQIIEEAQRQRKPVIFVTGDLKDDWWWTCDEKQEDEPCRPRPELRSEFRQKTGFEFYMYVPHEFLDESKQRLDLETKIADATVREIWRYTRNALADLTMSFPSYTEPTVLDSPMVRAVEEARRELSEHPLIRQVEEEQRRLREHPMMRQVQEAQRRLWERPVMRQVEEMRRRLRELERWQRMQLGGDRQYRREAIGDDETGEEPDQRHSGDDDAHRDAGTHRVDEDDEPGEDPPSDVPV